LSIVTIAISIGYFTYLEGMKQQTLGKMILDIIVVREDLRPISMNESIRRNIVRILYQVPFIFQIIDAFLILSDEQRIGDKIAKTYVIEKNFYNYLNAQSVMPPPPPMMPQAPQQPPPPPPPPPTPPPPDDY
jgi:uncharacterized RDD family membrane protein YckC